MSLSFHIDFDGQCKEAFEFYAEHLGGTIGIMLQFKACLLQKVCLAIGKIKSSMRISLSMK
jgi:uncharacterized glyoxalase superfamily protein PhnB